MEKILFISLTTSELRSLIAELLDEKLQPALPQVNTNMDAPPLCSRLEVAKLFGVSKTTIDKWRRCRILPPSVKIATRVYFYKDQIIELLKKRQRNPSEFNNI